MAHTYKLIGKILQDNKITAYRLEDLDTGKQVDVSRASALANTDRIVNAKVRGNYLVTTNRSVIQRISAKTEKVQPQYKFRDFSSYPISPLVLEGVSPKFAVKDIVHNGLLIIKQGKTDGTGKLIRDYLSEFISCRIAQVLGYNVQHAELGTVNGRECVAVKFFGSLPISFKGLGYSTLSDEKLHSRDVRYNLDWLLSLRINPQRFAVSQAEYTQWVLRVFLLDMFIGNYDRHEGNWGFLMHNGKKTPSPLFDMGASLFIRDMDKVVHWSKGQIKSAVETGIRSAILYKGKKRSYFAVLHAYADQQNIQQELRAFISNVETHWQGVTDVLSEVAAFNSAYQAYCTFVEQMLYIKLQLLKGFLNKEG